MKIDLNADVGESYGAWKMGNDAELMKYVDSVNIACGFHAGDPTTIRQTIDAALAHKVNIGAHPSFPDRQGFGRRLMTLSTSEIHDLMLYQISALRGVCLALGGNLRHVKPHGALYNLAAVDAAVAAAIADAVRKIDPALVLVGLSGSKLITAGKELGLQTMSEVFADRTYQADGTLTPRSAANALISNENDSAEQVRRMMTEGIVVATNGITVPITAETICLHGDGEHAVDFARRIRTLVDQTVAL